ncbi:hypothetical protein [Winogradskyella sp. Asnod2-B02-A]|uniref:hypothetical protein n=1 Tax=Winogradskyella sp. Asnod2-B02-A TaxID=3160583 RepID=UPI0038701DAA
MKKATILLLIIICNYSFGQNNLTDSELKSGIYLTYESLFKNNPLEFENLIVKKEKAEKNWQKKETYILGYKLKMSNEESDKLGTIIGFSDGENVYLTLSRDFYNNAALFYKVDFIGRFLYYEGTYRNLNSGLSNTTNVVDLKTQTIYQNFTNGNLKKILSDKPELLTRFKKEKKKYTHYRKYLAEYSE